MNNEKIPMPTQEEKEKAIANILTSYSPSVWRDMVDTFRNLGFKNIFCVICDCIFLSLIILLICLLFIAEITIQNHSISIALFLLSPMLYATLMLLTAWKEIQFKTLELICTFKISIRTIIALRMLCFGGGTVFVCVPINLIFWHISCYDLSLLWMIALSLSSLFLYGALSLFCQRLRRLIGLLLAPTIWICLGVILLFFERAAIYLERIPIIVFFLIAFAGLVFYLFELRRFYKRQTVGGNYYVKC